MSQWDQILENAECFFAYRSITVGPVRFNVTVQVIPEYVSLWHSHLISLRSSKKRPEVLSSTLSLGFGGLHGCAARNLLLHFSEFLPELLFNDHIIIFLQRPCYSWTKCSLPHQPSEGWLTVLLVHWKHFSKTSKRVSFQHVNTVVHGRQSPGSRRKRF